MSQAVQAITQHGQYIWTAKGKENSSIGAIACYPTDINLRCSILPFSWIKKPKKV